LSKPLEVPITEGKQTRTRRANVRIQDQEIENNKTAADDLSQNKLKLGKVVKKPVEIKKISAVIADGEIIVTSTETGKNAGCVGSITDWTSVEVYIYVYIYIYIACCSHKQEFL
jgi:hypothetical protein